MSATPTSPSHLGSAAGGAGADRAATDDWEAHWPALSESAAANPAQAYRRALVLDALDLARAPAPVRVLELGSGQGDMSRDLMDVAPTIELCGLDFSSSGVAIASRKVPAATFFQQDFTQPITVPERYRGWATHAVCTEVLEHLDDPAAALRNLRQLMAPGCRLVITVPSGPMSAFDHHIGHRGHFTTDRLAQTMRAAGLEIEDLRGAGFPFFNIYRLVVIARGKKLIEDAGGGAERPLPLTARALIRVFSWLFRMNRSTGTRGWQLVAVAREPAGAGARSG